MPGWVRIAMPSGADLIFIALLAALVFTPLAERLLGDASIGWHIRAGQQILTTHNVPHVDPFSSTMGGQPWFAWEWLYDVAVGLLETHLGINGVVWFAAVAIAAVFAWTFRLLILEGTNLLVALLLMLLSLSASMIHILARPHVWSWLFALAWFWVLDSRERDASNPHDRRLWFLPLLMLVWVNVHGGFVLGFVLLAIFWLAAVWEWFRSSGDRIEEALQRISAGKRARDLALTGLLSAIASLINPYGWKLHQHVYSYLTSRFLMEHIDEFRSPDFHGIAQRCFLILLLITVAALAARGRELRMSQILTVLFAVYSGLYASRNLPVSSVLLVIIVGPVVSRGFQPRRPSLSLGESSPFSRMNEFEARMRGHVWPVLAAVLTFAIAASGGNPGSPRLMHAHFDPVRMPVAAVNYVTANQISGPVFAPDYWGGYLIYRLYPKMKVAVDDRHDFYGEEFFKSYLKLVHVEPGWEQFLRAHDVECLILPHDAPLSSLLVRTGEWKEVYLDEVALVFVRGGDPRDAY